MEEPTGIIYIRKNELCVLKQIIKIGITGNGKNRDDAYTTYEHVRGAFIMVIEIPLNIMRTLDKMLKNYFKEYNDYKGGGTEYYKVCVIDKIVPYLELMNIKFKVLSTEEIETLERKYRVNEIKRRTNISGIIDNLDINMFIQKLKINKQNKNKNKIKPNEQQQIVLDMIKHFYVVNNIGKILWACGLGKALLSVLMVKLLGFKSIVFGVPSKNLQKQIKNEILKIFPNKSNILFVGGDKSDDIKSTTGKNQIKQFLNNNINDEPKWVIVTYHSCNLLINTIKFDFKIGDEAHHLVGIEKIQDKGFRFFHNIESKKTLFMTATEKMIESRTNKVIYSMNDETIFGKCIDTKSICWAIEHERITDYNVLVLKNNEKDVDELISISKSKVSKIKVTNKELFISAYMCLKSLEQHNGLTHILLYTNTTNDANLCEGYINEMLQSDNFKLLISKRDIYNKSLHSKNCKNIESAVNDFIKYPYGIISCVYIFGEGFDLPKLNGVCIAGNMQSETRIVQYLLRPNRLEPGNPEKRAYIIIPYIEMDDNFNVVNKSYGKVRTIISQMRHIDENIEQKIVVSTVIKKTKIGVTPRKPGLNNQDFDLVENINELNKLKIRLRYSKDLVSNFTEEQDEYNYIREINNSLNIQSPKEYIERKTKHSQFIPDPENYFKKKGVWNYWYDFMGFDTSKFIQSKQEWIDFCNEKQITSLERYYKSCELYDNLPKEPAEFYKEFTNISNELGFTMSCRRRR